MQTVHVNEPVFKGAMLTEGGKAVKGAHIKREDIPNTLENFEQFFLKPVLGLSLGECAILGSTGRKPESGDIDLGLPLDKVFGTTEDDYFHHYPEYLEELFPEIDGALPGSRLNMIFRQYHTPVPIIGADGVQLPDVHVQIDLIPGNIEYLKFSMASFPDKSIYPSWVRNSLLVALGRLQVFDEYEESEGGSVYRSRMSYNAIAGLVEKVEYTLPDDIKPDRGHTLTTNLITSNPDEVVQLLFNDENVRAQQVITAEGALDILIQQIRSGKINGHSLASQFESLFLASGASAYFSPDSTVAEVMSLLKDAASNR